MCGGARGRFHAQTVCRRSAKCWKRTMTWDKSNVLRDRGSEIWFLPITRLPKMYQFHKSVMEHTTVCVQVDDLLCPYRGPTSSIFLIFLPVQPVGLISGRTQISPSIPGLFFTGRRVICKRLFSRVSGTSETTGMPEERSSSSLVLSALPPRLK